MNPDDIDIFDPKYQSNPQLRGQYPGDSADLSALGLIPDMAKGFVNDAVRYGKQALTGNMRTDEELLARPELQGDAATVSDMLGQGMNAAMNFRGLASTDEFPLPSAADALGGAIGMYQDAKPELIDIFGEKPINQLEGTALLGSMILPGKVRQATKTGLYSQAAESAMDLERKSGNVQGYMNDLTGKGKVKPDELRAIGFEDNFAGRNDIPRQEVQQYINDNQIRLDETILGTNQTRYGLFDNNNILVDSFATRVESDAALDGLPDDYFDGDEMWSSGEIDIFTPSKFSEYTLGGGTQNNNYREILIQLPEGDDIYKGGHYSGVDNVAMTLRLNDRVDTENKKGLLVEEIQDDWASAGNDSGYKDKANIARVNEDLDKLGAEEQRLSNEMQRNQRLLGQFKFDDYLESRYNPESLRIRRLRDDLLNNQFNNLLPDRPFKSTDKSSDYNVAIKRALVEAANGDYDRLYLTTGQQQADRYDLSKQINEVRLDGDEIIGFTVSAFDKNDAPVIMETIKSLDELPNLIGKDAAKSIVDQPITGTAFGSARILAGQDLSIGGEGMKQFYDKTYRNALAKMVKPYGVKVGQADLPSGQLSPSPKNPDLLLFGNDTVYSVDITPKMREDFKKGIPMFAGGGAVDTTNIFEYNLGGSVSQMMRDPDEERAAGPTGPQAASFAMNLPPGAGLTDAFGYMPQLPGSEAGYEDIFDQPNYPSMAANIGQGEYLDAGFQGLGVLGDLATAVPFVGPALGALIKTPGALRKASKLSKLKDSSTGGIDSLAQDIVRVPDGIDTIDNARIISAKAGLTKKQTINALRDQFMLDHVPVGELTTISGKPAPATESLIKKRANAYVKRINNNPAVYRRESYRLGQSNQTTPLQERRIIHPEELLGKTGVPVVGDRSIRLVGDDKAGRGIESIAGVPLSSEHIAQGGLVYTIDNAGKTIILPGGAETNRAWASMKDAANKKQANFAYAAEQADSDDVIGVFSAMAKNSINFSADSLIPMMKQLPAIRIPKKDIKAFDDKIRKGVEKIDADGKVTTTARPDWLGLEHPEVFDQLLGKGEFSRDGAGAFRKTIIEEMMKKNWEDLGFPVYDDMIATMTVPELGKFMTGESGMSMFTGNPKAITFADEDHLSYGTSIPGDYFGGLKGSVPPEVMYPKMFDMLSKQMTNPKKGTPRPLNYSEQVGSLMMNPKLYETYDAESIEGIVNYMNKNLGTDYAEGGEVSAEDQVDIFDV